METYSRSPDEQQKMIIFQRGLFDCLLPIWALPSVSEMRDKMQVFSQGINTLLVNWQLGAPKT